MAGWGDFEGEGWQSWTTYMATKSLNQAKETTASSVTRTSDDSTFTGTPSPTSNPVNIVTTPSPSPSPTPTNGLHFDDPDAQAFWDNLEPGHRIALVIGVVVGVLIIIFLSAWYCCNCCGARARRGRQRIPDGPPRQGQGLLPLHTIHNRGPMNPSPVTPHPQPAMRPMLTGDVPPPSYDEAVPHNQRLQRGLSIRTTADDGVIADGKTPLSEIVFEDVEINHTNSASSASRTFQQEHHGWGDTRGHTNS
ncbi:hypothetical protein B0J14DRAFT_562362 [Halenospora varia]|nr:hypothetical protein B0J14DRAFT_562362 [Halenospora varia]